MKNLLLDKHTIIAVIGFGRFGKLMVEILRNHSQANIVLVSSKKISITHKNLTVETMSGIKKADIVIPCVPISSFESVIKQIIPFVKKEAIVMDVCSVKMLPVEIMKKYLPKSVQIIATHPMFGPDSYEIKKQLKDLKFVIWNISAKKNTYQQVKKFFYNLDLQILELSPKDHDKFMAWSLGYSYLLGKISQRINIKKTPIDTYDFQLLLEHVSIVRKDSEQLFIDMQTKNSFAKDMLEKFTKTVTVLSKEIALHETK